jgi:hypothetical protein
LTLRDVIAKVFSANGLHNNPAVEAELAEEIQKFIDGPKEEEAPVAAVSGKPPAPPAPPSK